MRVLLADVPVDIGRDDARAAAEAELANPEYRSAEPSLPERLLNWLVQRVEELFHAISGTVPGGPLGVLVVLALVVVLAVVIRLRVGRFARSARTARAVFAGNGRAAAADHRCVADEAAARGDFGVAVRERFRAIVRGMEERGLLDERSGRTADEAAAEAGTRLPALSGELAAAATLFDDVHYGGRPAAAGHDRTLAALDERCRSTRPEVAV